MKTTEPDAAYFGVFAHSFRIQARLLLVWGYEKAYQRITSDSEEEPAITGFIVEAIDDILRTLDCPKWCKQYFVRDDPPVKKKGTSGRSRPRADIIIQANFLGRPEYVFEAKRLRKRGYGVSKYWGEDGMGCFIRGIYAPQYDEAAMIGYVQSDSLEYWQSAVQKAIEKQKNSLSLKFLQRDAKILSDFPLEWVSEHGRDTVGRPISIYHILLDCRV